MIEKKRKVKRKGKVIETKEKIDGSVKLATVKSERNIEFMHADFLRSAHACMFPMRMFLCAKVHTISRCVHACAFRKEWKIMFMGVIVTYVGKALAYERFVLDQSTTSL